MKGRLGKNIELEYTQGENRVAVVNFTIATYVGKDKENEWIPCRAFGYVAERLAKGKKGDLVVVDEYRVRNPRFTGKDGNSKTYTYCEVSSAEIVAKVSNDPEPDMEVTESELPF